MPEFWDAKAVKKHHSCKLCRGTRWKLNLRSLWGSLGSSAEHWRHRYLKSTAALARNLGVKSAPDQAATEGKCSIATAEVSVYSQANRKARGQNSSILPLRTISPRASFPLIMEHALRRAAPRATPRSCKDA
jgi:hypothetical protein